MTFEQLQALIEQWSTDRGIFAHSTATAQLLKAISEMGELADAQAKNSMVDKIDAVGDVLVCLINYCHMTGISPIACLAAAYDVIKDRKGRMIAGGVFVKHD